MIKSTLVYVTAWCPQANIEPAQSHHMALLGHSELMPGDVFLRQWTSSVWWQLTGAGGHGDLMINPCVAFQI